MIQENGHLMLVDFDLSTKLSRSPLTKSSPSPSPSPSPKPDPKKKRFSKLYTCCNPAISSNDSVHPAESVKSDLPSDNKSNSFVGTEEYVSPEMIQGKGHDYSVDWWCLGIVLHEMLYGTTPFRGINRKETFYRILSKTPELVGEPNPLRDLIRKLLEKDPKQRICVAEIKGHNFFKGVDWEKVVHISRPPFIPGRFDDEYTDRIKNIDVEDFVRGVFKVDDDVIADDKEKKIDQTQNGVENFLVF